MSEQENASGTQVPCISLLGAIGIDEEADESEDGFRYWITIAGQRVGSPGNFTDINTVRDWLEIAAPNAAGEPRLAGNNDKKGYNA